ncbi:hypothetical protein NFI96_029126 [Prochilodus magdalenae]|nr:hypothetical protein NFI96_029126 [Prochilodus magdalenae]
MNDDGGALCRLAGERPEHGRAKLPLRSTGIRAEFKGDVYQVNAGAVISGTRCYSAAQQITPLPTKESTPHVGEWGSNPGLGDYAVLHQRTRCDHSPLHIDGSAVEIVMSTKFLGVHLAEDLTWSLNTSTITKKAQQRLYFLRRLRKAHLPPPILTTFYRGTIESILSSCITAWFGNCITSDHKSLQRVVRTAEKIIGVSLPTITDIYTTRCIRKANSIVGDYTHPSHTLSSLLPSGKRINTFPPQHLVMQLNPGASCQGDLNPSEECLTPPHNTVIYLKAKSSDTLTVQSHNLSCHPFPATCQVMPPSSSSTRWQRTACQEVSSFKHSLNCSWIQTELNFIMEPLSREEEDYPLAFIITIHKEFEMFVRLLRAIYAPQNVYCIHVDNNAPQSYKESVKNLAGCFPNTFLASVSERVTYAGFSRLKADINCMEDLVKSPVKWRKVINLCGQDFPTMSNLELVRYMQAADWRDRNMTPGIKQPDSVRHRTQTQHVEIKGLYVVSKGHRKKPPPHNLQIYFGTAYYALTRAFVEYVLNSLVAKDLLEWSKDTYSPDEHYWVTLNHVKDAPGSNIHGGWEGDIRAIKWRDQEGAAHQGCNGRYVRDICIYATEDLPWVIEKNSMFANKFESSRFPEALDCLEQWHRHKVLQQTMVPIQLSWRLATELNISSVSTAA